VLPIAAKVLPVCPHVKAPLRERRRGPPSRPNATANQPFATVFFLSAFPGRRTDITQQTTSFSAYPLLGLIIEDTAGEFKQPGLSPLILHLRRPHTLRTSWPVPAEPAATKKDATADQARPQPVWLGDDRLPVRLRAMPPRQLVCADAEE
jgi:hypothetical protein